MRVIIDAMGGDNAPQAPVMGGIAANREYGVDITLVGRGEEILQVLRDNGIDQLPNVRKISISPWCNEAYMGEQLAGSRIIYSRKCRDRYGSSGS